MGFIYFLIVLLEQYENGFKIGCTEDFHNRIPDYGGSLGPAEYQSDIIEITNIPIQIKLKYHYKDNINSLCEHAEAHLHECYSKLRVKNPTSHRLTEFFNPPNKVSLKDIEDLLNKANIGFKHVGLYDKNNHLNELHKQSKQKVKPSKSKINKEFNEKEKEEINKLKKQWIEEPLKFIEQMILSGSELRSIQKKLWDILNKNSDNLDRILNGIIKWPTGTGKRISIIMVIMFIFKKYRETGEILRISVITHRNDICDSAWSEYELLEQLGLRVIKGYLGNFHKSKITKNESYVLITTHQALIGKVKNQEYQGNIKKIKELNLDMIIYDEVHHITGDEMFDYLKDKDNKPKYLVGISATPETDDKIQNERINELFNNHYISECTYSEAIEEGWINDCLYHIYSCENYPTDEIVSIINKKI